VRGLRHRTPRIARRMIAERRIGDARMLATRTLHAVRGELMYVRAPSSGRWPRLVMAPPWWRNSTPSSQPVERTALKLCEPPEFAQPRVFAGQ